MDNNAVALAAIALAASMVTGFLALIRGALKDLVRANERIADEAKARNGQTAEGLLHLAELVTATAKHSDEQALLNQRALEAFSKEQK